MLPASADTLHHLRQSVAEIEAHHPTFSDMTETLSLGMPSLDAALGGGLAVGALHELAPSLPLHAGAATGFVLALASLANKQRPRDHVLWIQSDFIKAETGALYGPGLELYGLSLKQFIVVAVPRAVDVLWAMEDALRSRAVKTVIGEVPDEHVLDEMPATRRLSLTARDNGGLGLLVRSRPAEMASAAATRFEISAAPGPRDEFGGLGRTAFSLSLTKNRRGARGRWLITWNHHDRVFLPALSVGVAAAARDRSDRAPLASHG